MAQPIQLVYYLMLLKVEFEKLFFYSLHSKYNSAPNNTFIWLLYLMFLFLNNENYGVLYEEIEH